MPCCFLIPMCGFKGHLFQLISLFAILLWNTSSPLFPHCTTSPQLLVFTPPWLLTGASSGDSHSSSSSSGGHTMKRGDIPELIEPWVSHVHRWPCALVSTSSCSDKNVHLVIGRLKTPIITTRVALR